MEITTAMVKELREATSAGVLDCRKALEACEGDFEEAIAHLKYAITHGDGFVEINGEVGTGKTTLCRSFLKSLDENYEVAYIFNPILTPVEFLKAINDEYGINSDFNSAKGLIDTLNTFLLKQKTI